jgi:hypothetical protein
MRHRPDPLQRDAVLAVDRSPCRDRATSGLAADRLEHHGEADIQPASLLMGACRSGEV